jgi:hypothetical protein
LQAKDEGGPRAKMDRATAMKMKMARRRRRRGRKARWSVTNVRAHFFKYFGRDLVANRFGFQFSFTNEKISVRISLRYLYSAAYAADFTQRISNIHRMEEPQKSPGAARGYGYWVLGVLRFATFPVIMVSSLESSDVLPKAEYLILRPTGHAHAVVYICRRLTPRFLRGWPLTRHGQSPWPNRLAHCITALVS